MELTNRFTEALAYAAELHAGQRRKASGVPYLAHLLGVAEIALQFGADEDEAIAALLHDAVEDQGGAATGAEIRRRFGGRVAEIVDGVSDCDSLPKPPWKPRKDAALARLRHAGGSVRLVAAADKLHNARSLLIDYHRHGAALWRHFRGGRDGTLWYLRASVDVLKQNDASSPLVAELERTVAELEATV